MRCSSLKACPTWPISSSPYGRAGASFSTSTCSPWRSRATTRGSRSTASSCAAWRSPASRRIRLRAIRNGQVHRDGDGDQAEQTRSARYCRRSPAWTACPGPPAGRSRCRFELVAAGRRRCRRPPARRRRSPAARSRHGRWRRSSSRARPGGSSSRRAVAAGRIAVCSGSPRRGIVARELVPLGADGLNGLAEVRRGEPGPRPSLRSPARSPGPAGRAPGPGRPARWPGAISRRRRREPVSRRPGSRRRRCRRRGDRLRRVDRAAVDPGPQRARARRAGPPRSAARWRMRSVGLPAAATALA